MKALLLALSLQPGPLEEARQLADAGRIAEAIDLLQEEDDDPRRLALLAELLARSDRIPEAERALALALQAAPEQTEWAVTRASLLFQLSRYAEARAALEPALAARPDHPFANYYLGAILLRTGDPEEAARRAERALASGAPRAEALHLLGEARLKVGEDAAGEAALRQALEAAPWHPGPAWLLGQHLIETGRDAEGARFLDRFARASRAAEAVELGVQLLPRDPAAAERQFREALRIFPGHLPASRLLARSRR